MKSFVDVWNGCMNEPCGILRWIECHTGLAGYLQFVGVIGAILGTAYATYWATTRSLKAGFDERARRAKVAVYLLMPAVAEIKATCVRVRKVYEQTNGGSMLVASGHPEEAIYSLSIDAKLSGHGISDMHQLDERTAEVIAQLHYYLDRYNKFIVQNVPLLETFTAASTSKYAQTFETLFGAVEKLTAEAWEKLQAAR